MPTIILGFPQSRKDAGEDPLLKELRPLWQAGGLKVLTLKLTIGEDDSVLAREMEAAVDQCDRSKLVIGGFSLGARIALRVATRVRPAALLCLGFPFHPPGQPQALKGANLFVGHDIPTLIVQGARDPHGAQNEAKNYQRLPDCVRFRWIEDANHRFETRQKSPWSRKEHLLTIANRSLEFARQTLEWNGNV
ncbi:MAG: putative alpha/beta-hydrolase family hydrolase [Candidatus Azotimanducaceae bacterium]|jgi:predicted alpha/beta-hydrolase family hydrolase